MRKHVYFMPGMAANIDIFEQLKLSEDKFILHFMSWKIPTKKEAIESYALRMTKEIKHNNPILVGVSFGGIIVQEMARLIPIEKLVLISTIKKRSEMPFRMRAASFLKLYHLAPTLLLSKFDKIEKYVLSSLPKNKIKQFKKYLSISNKSYLDWALKEMCNWKEKVAFDNAIRIHGTSDIIFPFKHIEGDVIPVKNGSHAMIVTRASWFNENLPEIILGK